MWLPFKLELLLTPIELINTQAVSFMALSVQLLEETATSETCTALSFLFRYIVHVFSLLFSTLMEFSSILMSLDFSGFYY